MFISNDQNIIQYSKYLWLLILSYSMTLSMSNWYDSRIVEIFGIAVTPGSLVYSITFLFSNVITEVYGFKNARKAILTAFMFNVIFIIYGWIILHLPTPLNININQSFDDFLTFNLRIILASFISYLISEPTNSYIIAKLKRFYNGKYIGIRFIASTLISGAIDSMLFTVIAFYHAMPNDKLFGLIIHIWMVKTIIEVLGLPLSISVAKKLKEVEKMDIFDTNTQFTLFSFDSKYSKSNNKF
ncbi:queuosine precursor transporter (plasmid) [Legionella geestiana]|nr:queuosine precursor transporter [Legionella geestiana]